MVVTEETMKLSVKNIGKLESAEIDISGITVVAGGEQHWEKHHR